MSPDAPQGLGYTGPANVQKPLCRSTVRTVRTGGRNLKIIIQPTRLLTVLMRQGIVAAVACLLCFVVTQGALAKPAKWKSWCHAAASAH